MFPPKPDFDYDTLRITPEGLYSVTRRKDGEALIEFMVRMIPDMGKKSCTDATACVGSDTLRFSQVFRSVKSIEWKHDNLVALRHNVRAFGAKNVSVFDGDATRVFHWKTDVLYIDPPWGGPEYYKQRYVDLRMGEIRLDKWIQEILERHVRPSHILLKLPRNYNFAHLNFLPNVDSMHFYRIRNFAVVLLRASV